MGHLKSNIMGIYFDPSTRTFASKGFLGKVSGMFASSKPKSGWLKTAASGLKSGFINGVKNAPQLIGNAVVENAVSGLAGMAVNYGMNKGVSLMNKRSATPPPEEEEQVQSQQSNKPTQVSTVRR